MPSKEVLLLSEQDLVIGFMRYAQRRGVRSFPRFLDHQWQEFLHEVRKRFSHLMPASINMRFEWDGRYPKLVGRVEINEALVYMTVSVPPGQWGLRVALREDELRDERFADDFPELVRGMLETAKEKLNFLEV